MYGKEHEERENDNKVRREQNTGRRKKEEGSKNKGRSEYNKKEQRKGEREGHNVAVWKVIESHFTLVFQSRNRCTALSRKLSTRHNKQKELREATCQFDGLDQLSA